MGEKNDRNARCPKCNKKFKDCSGHWQKPLALIFASVIVLGLVAFLIINNQGQQNATVQPEKSASPIKPGEKPVNPKTEKTSQRPITVTPSKEPLDPEREKQVRLLQKEWLEAAQFVVRETNDPTAKEIYKFIIENGILCYPDEQNYRIVDVPKKGKLWFGFVPLPDYAKDIPKLKDVFSEDTAGYFVPEDRVLIVLENPPVSKIWRGLIVLHEGYHAKAYLTGSDDWDDSQFFWRQEVDAYSFQIRLIKKIGGKRYQQCLQKELENIQNTAKVENGVLQSFDNVKDYNPLLDEVFGAPLSEVEKKIRQHLAWVAAMFDFLDKTAPEPYGAKAIFLKTIYAENGVN